MKIVVVAVAKNNVLIIGSDSAEPRMSQTRFPHNTGLISQCFRKPSDASIAIEAAPLTP